MAWIIAAIVAVLWLLGWLVFEIAEGLIHLLLVVAVVAVEGLRTVLDVATAGTGGTSAERVAVLGAVVAFGFLGLVDDLLGDSGDRGLRGHVGAALRGRVTTGFLKLGGGIAVAVVLSGFMNGNRPGQVLVDAVLISLAANLGNLLDRAPGRTLKWALVAYIPLAVAGGTSEASVALAVVIGASLALMAGDVREVFMLGDTGANALGAALGVVTALVAPPIARIVAAGILVFLTLLSEVVSFSRVIGAVAPLRVFDRWGRLPGEERG
ncbi:MAG: hypothetical protein KY393_08540 [Actinobacteria bacterium]|nr:hypothetical protein [Actinomycetota bacterium]